MNKITDTFIKNAGKSTEPPLDLSPSNRRATDLSKWQPVIYWGISFFLIVGFIFAINAGG